MLIISNVIKHIKQYEDSYKVTLPNSSKDYQTAHSNFPLQWKTGKLQRNIVLVAVYKAVITKKRDSLGLSCMFNCFLPSSRSLTSLAAFSPSSLRFLSIILLLSTAALSSVLNVQPILPHDDPNRLNLTHSIQHAPAPSPENLTPFFKKKKKEKKKKKKTNNRAQKGVLKIKRQEDMVWLLPRSIKLFRFPPLFHRKSLQRDEKGVRRSVAIRSPARQQATHGLALLPVRMHAGAFT